MKHLILAMAVLFAFVSLAFAEGGVKKRKPLPYEFGSVVIGNFSGSAGLSPVVFDHWIHRSKYTCRVCHVDIGFGMSAGSTKIRAADNGKGFYCGTCHNGKSKYENKIIFEACSGKDSHKCGICHSMGRNPLREQAFAKFAENLPKERLGNGINWQLAEEKGLISPINYLEGISIKRNAMSVQKDFSLEAKNEGMPSIIFSHSKHTVWNGCELCHPDIFLGVKKGATKYSMIDLFQGKYCGVCHNKVAFPQTDCQRCHVGSVEK
ncbi:MAG: hypothetical protein A2505_06620 [Deltaproteobacteria bacterium RIFOXYD12_FULL_55_16]|nr:MAG: hypothetical protein A2505_06620 [Deltaproteobacteria bacterium RIFOXYD12_FULL_55_16]